LFPLGNLTWTQSGLNPANVDVDRKDSDLQMSIDVQSVMVPANVGSTCSTWQHLRTSLVSDADAIISEISDRKIGLINSICLADPELAR
jgi:hypothetical protein